MRNRGISWGTCALAALALWAAAAGAISADSGADDRLKQRIQMRLSGQVALHIESLSIQVQDGDVRMGGSVGSLGERVRAEKLVTGVVGVRNIVNELSVKPTDRSEIAIAQDVQRRLGTRTRFRKTPIEVKVSGTVVTLAGVVERAIDRLDAEEFASEALGVTQVVNNLEVRPERAVTADAIRSRVLSVLTNPLTFGAIRNPEVTVEEGTVTLRGVVTREADRSQAERLALGVPGVTGVINLITLAEGT